MDKCSLMPLSRAGRLIRVRLSKYSLDLSKADNLKGGQVSRHLKIGPITQYSTGHSRAMEAPSSTATSQSM